MGKKHLGLVVACAIASPHICAAGVANGDWKSGDFTDWSLESTENPAQESGVAAFTFKLAGDAVGPIQPCAAQGGEGNCAAFFGAGGLGSDDAAGPVGTGASIYLSQNGGPPPMGTGLLFLEAGTTYQFAADIAAASRSSAVDPDGGTIRVRVAPVAIPMGQLVTEFTFGPIAPQEVIQADLIGEFIPTVSDFYVLEIEFHRDFPHVPGESPLNWIDNIEFEPVDSDPPAGVPAASGAATCGLILVIALAATAGLRTERMVDVTHH